MQIRATWAGGGASSRRRLRLQPRPPGTRSCPGLRHGSAWIHAKRFIYKTQGHHLGRGGRQVLNIVGS